MEHYTDSNLPKNIDISWWRGVKPIFKTQITWRWLPCYIPSGSKDSVFERGEKKLNRIKIIKFHGDSNNQGNQVLYTVAWIIPIVIHICNLSFIKVILTSSRSVWVPSAWSLYISNNDIKHLQLVGREKLEKRKKKKSKKK